MARTTRRGPSTCPPRRARRPPGGAHRRRGCDEGPADPQQGLGTGRRAHSMLDGHWPAAHAPGPARMSRRHRRGNHSRSAGARGGGRLGGGEIHAPRAQMATRPPRCWLHSSTTFPARRCDTTNVREVTHRSKGGPRKRPWSSRRRRSRRYVPAGGGRGPNSFANQTPAFPQCPAGDWPQIPRQPWSATKDDSMARRGDDRNPVSLFVGPPPSEAWPSKGRTSHGPDRAFIGQDGLETRETVRKICRAGGQTSPFAASSWRRSSSAAGRTETVELEQVLRWSRGGVRYNICAPLRPRPCTSTRRRNGTRGDSSLITAIILEPANIGSPHHHHHPHPREPSRTRQRPRPAEKEGRPRRVPELPAVFSNGSPFARAA